MAGFDVETIDGRTLLHIGRNVEECCAYYREKRIDAVVVNPARGYLLSSIEQIARFGADIEDISVIQPRAAFGLAPLYGLRRLRRLHIGGYCSLDLSRFPFLKAFSADFHDEIIFATTETALESLSLSIVAGGRDIDAIPAIPALKALSVVGSRQLSLGDLAQRMPVLAYLNLGMCRKLRSIDAVRFLVGLRLFYATACRRLEGYDVLSQCAELRQLRLNNCGPITSIGFIDALSKLQEFRFVGTRVLDGQVGRLSSLKWASFDRQKGYSHTPDQIDEILRRKGGGALVRPGDNYVSQWPFEY